MIGDVVVVVVCVLAACTTVRSWTGRRTIVEDVQELTAADAHAACAYLGANGMFERAGLRHPTFPLEALLALPLAVELAAPKELPRIGDAVTGALALRRAGRPASSTVTTIEAARQQRSSHDRETA